MGEEMKLSNEYNDTARELSRMEQALAAVVVGAKTIGVTLELVKCADEQALLIIKIGKIMDKHAKDMEDI